ncbi:prepilin-type cleavage/methylation domain-containing protein [Inmirania thermothiophila]|uniref:Prepilin-type N-terminal cleavage/methylation domain-containing protein n=1 Tax=Inmirania thermothiophila TaxID=1750597 RepID=A0A3N1Y6N2_9GAMM|nr:prepilin-type cleavage/methylation domain-containing protein [Inmirania thermothiophila]ROR34201.1 hypothetical protein EDC57_0097 [Inmirania thermothiophila]
MRWRARGFSLLELTLVVIVVVLLIRFAIDRLLPLRIEAERVAVAQVVGGLRSALGLEAARRVVSGGVQALAALDGGNPMLLLQQVPQGYVGEAERVDPAALPPGAWAFERASGILIYRVRFAEHFRGGGPGPPHIRFRVRLVYEDVDGDGRFAAGEDLPQGLDLVALEPYTWLKD